MRWSTAKSKAEILQNASSPRRCVFSCPQPKVCRYPPKKPIHHGILGEEQLGGASADARSYWQGRFAACTFCWACLTNWSPDQQLGRCPKPHKGRCPLTLQGADEKGRSPPLDPFSRLSWSHFHAPSACSFLVLRLSPYLLPKLSVKNQKTCLQNAADCAKMPKHPHFSEDSARWRPCFLS